MSEQLRVGIVGTSWWTDQMHLPSLKSHAQVQVVAICGRNQARGQEIAAKYEIPQVFTDYQEMIEQADLQALVIAIPDDMHYPVAMAALDAGLHVLCEKPLAFDVQQAGEMTARAEAMGVKHMVLFTWRWLPHYQYFHELVTQGYVGRGYQCHFQFLHGKWRSDEYSWKADGSRSKGNLSIFASHMIDMARWNFGEIVRVSAHLGVYVERAGIAGQALEPANDATLLLAEFASGMQGVIQSSSVAHIGDRGNELNIRVYGEAGTLESDVIFGGGEAGAQIRGVRQGEESIKPLPVPARLQGNWDPLNYMEPFARQSVGPRLFVDAILEDRDLEPDFYDGLKVQEVIDSAVESHERGVWMAVSELGN